jgi:hypothetical protein
VIRFVLGFILAVARVRALRNHTHAYEHRCTEHCLTHIVIGLDPLAYGCAGALLTRIGAARKK